MGRILKERKRAIILLIVITLIGFYTKVYSGPAKDWVNNSLGGVFYEIFWCLIVSLLFKNPKSSVIAVWVFGVTCLLEFLQLSHLLVLEFIKRYFIGRVIIGTSFSRVDFIYYFVGSGVGYLIISRLQKRGYKHNGNNLDILARED